MRSETHHPRRPRSSLCLPWLYPRRRNAVLLVCPGKDFTLAVRGVSSPSPYFAMSKNGVVHALRYADRSLNSQVVPIQDAIRALSTGTLCWFPPRTQKIFKAVAKRKPATTGDQRGVTAQHIPKYVAARDQRAKRQRDRRNLSRLFLVFDACLTTEGSTRRDSDLPVTSADPLDAANRRKPEHQRFQQRAGTEEIIDDVVSRPDGVLAATYRDVGNQDAELTRIATEQ